MVKGISRQVIVVRSPDPALFEQAIFILREDALGREGMSDRAILRQARQAAGQFCPQNPTPRFHAPLWTGLGAVAMGLVWLLTAIF